MWMHRGECRIVGFRKWLSDTISPQFGRQKVGGGGGLWYGWQSDKYLIWSILTPLVMAKIYWLKIKAFNIVLDLQPFWSIDVPVLGQQHGEDLTTVLSSRAHQIIPTVRPFCPFVPSHFHLPISATDDTHANLIVRPRLFFIVIRRGWDTIGPVAICDAHLHESSCFWRVIPFIV